MAVSLFTTRVVLDVLGVEDYGIYNVVGGVVALFAFLNNAMVASSQRFIAYELGAGNFDNQLNTFSTAVVIHYLIAIIILLLSCTVGLWFLNYKMNIPETRMLAANVTFIAASFSFAINVTTVPYTASIIAHESMGVYAWVSIADAILKLSIVYLLLFLPGDKLVIYSTLLLVIGIANRIFYQVYAKRKFRECLYRRPTNRVLFKNMLSFASWSFFGNFAFSAKDYGVNIIVNIFTSVTVNAARGVAYQVMNAINGFVGNFQMAINPQIIKQYSIKNYSTALSLVIRSSKFSFALLAIVLIPFYIRMPYVMNLWLKEIPDLTLTFLKLAFIMGLVNSMAGPIVIAIQATGKIKIFQLTIAAIMLLDLPISYILLKFGYPPYSVMYVAIGTAVIGLIARILILNRLIPIKIYNFFFTFFIRNPLSLIIAYMPMHYVTSYIENSFIGLCVFCIASVLWSSLVFYFGIFDKKEKVFIRYKMQAYIKKIAKK